MTAVAAPLDRGLRRRCTACRAPFYDLRRDPIVCPMCSAVQLPPVVTARGRGAPTRFRDVPPSDQVPAASPAETVSEDEEDDEEKEEKDGEENDEADSDNDDEGEKAEDSAVDAPESDDESEEPGSDRST